jgi:hypothetical protein
MNIITTALALSQFAPIITKWIGGTSAESVANTVVNIAKNVTNSINEKEALQKLQSDKKLVAEFQKLIIESEKEIETAILKDRESARSRDIAFINSGRHNKRADIMVIAAALGLVACLAVICLFNKSLPGEAIGIISTVAGIFGSCLKDAYAFEFGSSRGSKEKDLTVASIIGSAKNREF